MFQEMAILRKETEKISKLEGDVSTKSKRRLERPIGRFLHKIERITRCAPLFGPETTGRASILKILTPGSFSRSIPYIYGMSAQRVNQGSMKNNFTSKMLKMG